MHKLLDITPLRSLIAVADAGGVHRAASTLSLTQSAVSQHMRRLEAVVGAPVVERTGRNVRFTPTGEALLAEARQIVGAHDAALVRLKVERTAQLVVGVTDHAADHTLPPIIAALGERFPDVQAHFRFDRARRLNEMVEQGAVDIAVFVTEPSSHAGVAIGRLPLHWCAADGWTPPPAGEPWPLVAIQAPCSIRDTALDVFAQSGLVAQVVGDAAYLAGVIQAARAGLGVALLAYCGAAPQGLTEIGDLPPAPPIRLAARHRQGADAEMTGTVLDALRGVLEPV